MIVHIDKDKHEFYIQDNDDIMSKIEREIANINEDLTNDEIHIDTMVISMYEDSFYRAIIQFDLNENVQVYFVDYGNTNICSKASLKKCTEQLKTYPYQAKRCQLSGISSNNLDQAYEKLNEYYESNNTEICIVHQQKDSFYVNLYINGDCFNQLLQHQSVNNSNMRTNTEQEQACIGIGKRNSEEILSPIENSGNTTMKIKRQKSESKTEGTKFSFQKKRKMKEIYEAKSFVVVNYSEKKKVLVVEC